MSDALIDIVLRVHAGATCFMVGLIWFVQIVHYPLMRMVSGEGFTGYALAHQRRTTWVVGPLMLIEAATSLAACSFAWQGRVSPNLAWGGLALLAIVWLSTFTLQVPMHARLGARFEHAHWRRLVVTNWIRTIAWTARGVVSLLLLAPHSSPVAFRV